MFAQSLQHTLGSRVRPYFAKSRHRRLSLDDGLNDGLSPLLIVDDPPGGPIEIEKQVGVVEKKRGFFHSLDALDDDHDAMLRTVGLVGTYVSSKQVGQCEKPETI